MTAVVAVGEADRRVGVKEAAAVDLALARTLVAADHEVTLLWNVEDGGGGQSCWRLKVVRDEAMEDQCRTYNWLCILACLFGGKT